MKGLAEAMTHIAQLETGQTNATALVLGDSLAYEVVEAKSAKDALLQRQYNIDELRNSIKTTINKRRTIEKLRASGNIKPERVNEALDDLEEAAKHEQTLQHRVEAISRNLRPALQTHLRTMNDDMLSIALGQARTMLAYENRKLQIYDGIHAKIAKIPERGAVDPNVVYYHQPQNEQEAPSTSSAVASSSTFVTPAAPAHPVSRPQAVGMSPSSSQHTHASASTTDISGAQSKFMATQAAIQAEMAAQRAREERQRAQFAQARAYQHQKQASLGRNAPPTETQAATPAPSTSTQARTPASPRAAQQNVQAPQSPLHSSAQQQRLPEQGNGNNRISGPSRDMSQSMFVQPQQQQQLQGTTSSQFRSIPQSPPRLQRTTSITHAPAAGGIDPLSPGGPLASSPFPANTQGPPTTAPQYQANQQHHQNARLPPSQNHQSNGNMTQSVFLPGRTAQPGSRPASQQNIADVKKVADARKAASFLAGAF